MLRRIFDFDDLWTVIDNERDTKEAKDSVIQNLGLFINEHDMYRWSLAIAQNLGAIGSMIFLFAAHIWSHSSMICA
jgi:hypothetical protein